MPSISVTYFGHSCFMVELNDRKILFDPFISHNPLANDIDIDTIKPDYILLTHGHFDHIADCVAIAKQSNAKVVAAYEITEWIRKQGIENVHPMNVGGKWSFDFGNVKCVFAAHSSSFPDGTYGGNPIGFVIESTAGNFYYAGDTALTYDMKLIGEYREIDFAFLPIGDNFTMDFTSALEAAKLLQVKKVIGMHFDTFDAIRINQEEAVNYFRTNGVELILLKIGETRIL